MDKVTTRSTQVRQGTTLEFVDPDGKTTALAAEFLDPADPFAVTTVFKTSAGEVAWTFARDLLIDGMYEPTGDGDVHVWPCLSASGSAVVILELCSPDGEVLVQASSRELNNFLTAVLASVPLGEETANVDLDVALGALLAG